MSKLSNRNEYFDIIKGLTIILVLFGHALEASSGMISRGSLSFFYDPIHNFIYSFHMPLFMIVSGYFFYKSYSRHNVSYMITSRIKSLLIPFLTFGVINGLLSNR